jgi:riboflavin kinase/FMN adenylyltransferase
VPLHRYRAALEGVFAVEVDGLGPRRPGVANIGVRPTVEGREPLLEVHLFDYTGDCYGALLTTFFRAKIRDEWKFDSLDALKAQIARDADAARSLLGVAP